METMAEKLKENEPYNLFFTTIPDSPETYSQQNSITFTDLLCPSLGELKCSLQLSYILDIKWLMEQYVKMGQGDKPLTFLSGRKFPDMQEYIQTLPNVTPHYVQMPDEFGLHHSKVGIYVYSDNSLRIVVSTGNLYYADWNYFCNSLWVSPLCPALPEDSSDKDGESPTIFKSTLISYLQQYKIDILNSWIDYIKRADFSNVRVFLITSVPGSHSMVSRHCHLHTVGALLSKYCVLPDETASSEDSLSWRILVQSSSLGSFGSNAEWLRRALLRSLASHQGCRLPAVSNASVSVIFPTKKNTSDSYDESVVDSCLSYIKGLHEKQKWLENCLYQWKADNTYRTRAMPHCKMFCRISPCETKLAWFLMTSANASKAAWGGGIQKRGTIYVRSYEVGVLFIPKYFDQTYFEIKNENHDHEKVFPLMYDIPLTSYTSADEPWSIDIDDVD